MTKTKHDHDRIRDLKHFQYFGTHIYDSVDEVPEKLWLPWSQYFAPEEFADTETGLIIINEQFMNALIDLRIDCGFPFIITSGTRTEQTNEMVGGHPTSAHMIGCAVDVRAPNGQSMVKVAENFTRRGFCGLGVKRILGRPGWFHIDSVSRDPVMWTYD